MLLWVKNFISSFSEDNYGKIEITFLLALDVFLLTWYPTKRELWRAHIYLGYIIVSVVDKNHHIKLIKRKTCFMYVVESASMCMSARLSFRWRVYCYERGELLLREMVTN